MHYAILYFTVLHSKYLFHNVLHYIVMHCTIWNCTTLQCTAIHCTSQYSSILYCNILQYCTVQYSTVQCSTVQYSTVLYSTAQYSRVQYNIIQHSTGEGTYSRRRWETSATGWNLSYMITEAGTSHTPQYRTPGISPPGIYLLPMPVNTSLWMVQIPMYLTMPFGVQKCFFLDLIATVNVLILP